MEASVNESALVEPFQPLAEKMGRVHEKLRPVLLKLCDRLKGDEASEVQEQIQNLEALFKKLQEAAMTPHILVNKSSWDFIVLQETFYQMTNTMLETLEEISHE